MDEIVNGFDMKILAQRNIRNMIKGFTQNLPFESGDDKELLNFNNKLAVMLRRKNPDHTYLHPNPNHSPYRFERKNPNHSPGLSPMRCRTPTRGNISPFRTANNNDNYRGHSPIKFVTNKITNPASQLGKAFFRAQTHTNYQAHFNNKYATTNNNNDHSIKRQSFYENPSSSKINPPYQNSERTMLHQNTKLFSKLVEKINSEKKKQPQMVRRNTKPEIYRPQQISQVQPKPSPCVERLTKQKSQTDQSKLDAINEHIKPVESVVYEQRQTKTYTYQHQINNYTVSGKENKQIEHEHSYRLKQYKTEKTHSAGLEINKNNNYKTKEEEKVQMQLKVHQKSSTTPGKKDEEVQKEKSLKKQAQKQQQITTNKITTLPKAKLHQQHKKPKDYDDPNNFDDLELLLGKITNIPKPQPQEMKQSISNISSDSNVYNSINMDPYL